MLLPSGSTATKRILHADGNSSIYAEALLNGATQGKLTAAEAVNLVRNRANLASLSQVTLDDVKHERILELSLEGHRFYDLLRWGELSSRFQELSHDPTFKKFVSASDYKGFVTGKHEYVDFGNTRNSITESRGETFTYTIDNLLTYNKTFGGHSIDALVGTSWMREYYRSMGIDRKSTRLNSSH